MYSTIEDIKRANAESGYYFFAPDTMRFFQSRVLDGVIGGRYFITSEIVGWRPPRVYIVREARPDGSCGSAERSEDGMPITYNTPAAARAAARALSAESI